MDAEQVKQVASRYWIDYARPTALDADDDYHVEIRLSAPHRDVTVVNSFWGNVGLGTPWRHTSRWKNPVAWSQDAKDRKVQTGTEAFTDSAAATQPVVRTFRTITRAWHSRRSQWVLDAIADDGTAWCAYSVNDDLGAILWRPQLMLPQPDQPGD